MSVVDKLKHMMKGHPEQAKKGIEKGGDYVDKKTQGKYKGHVDKAQEKLKGQMEGSERGEQDSPPER